MNTNFALADWEGLKRAALGPDNSLAAWLVLVAGVVAGLAAGRLLAVVLAGLARRWEAAGFTGRARAAVGLAGPLKLAALTLGLNIGVAGLTLPESLKGYVWHAFVLLYAIAVVWFGYNAVDLIGIAIRRIGRTNPSAGERQIALLVSRTLRGLLLVVGVLFIAEAVFGCPIGAWLAGLGIAGLAVSLAAQDSLKQLFGSLAIMLDRSFQLGDHVISSGYEGTVEDVRLPRHQDSDRDRQPGDDPQCNLDDQPDRKPQPAACRSPDDLAGGAGVHAG